ncbi:MAG TPA: DUF885 domain-containing protein [Steroidobacteraceae bacterium]|nr:DUF885 domain-containing protein [Steroidobacteraceae bacterium]
MNQARGIFYTLVFGALALSAGGSAALAGTQAAPSTQSADEQLRQVAEDYWEEYLKLNPIAATIYGDNRYNDRLENSIGQRYLADTLALEKGYLEKLSAIDPNKLSSESRLSYEIFKFDREDTIEGLHFPSELIPVNQFFGLPNLFAQLGSANGLQPFATVKDYENWLKRIDGFVVWVNQAIDNMRSGSERGVVQPRVVMERVLPQLEALAITDPAKSVFYRPVMNLPASFSHDDKARLTAAYSKAINEKIVPAYRRLHDFIRDEYLPKTRATVGLNALPQGDRWYAYLVKSQTTTSKSPAEIHEIGLKEVARIRGEMEKVIQQVGFKGDTPAFFAYLRSEPRFYYTSPDDLLNGYRGLKDKVSAEIPRLFSIQPKADFEIQPVEEFRAKSAAGAQYRRATPDGSRPGVFYVNTYDLKSRPKYSMQSIFLHEAIPGHHFQISIQQELTDLPRFRRFGGFTAFAEGWGLYSESLGKELGQYTDPYDYFGALGAEIFRAVRLVLDTGLHSKGWTREQAIEYMTANTPNGPSDAIAEVERYIAVPGQALAYKMGELKIKELRARSAARLGARFDVREFHTQILQDGALPLDVLDAKVDRWLATARK